MTLTETPPVIATTVALDAQLLRAAMTKLKPALPTRATSSVLQCVLVETDGTDITLTASNLDVTLTTTITGLVSSPGTLAVPAAVVKKMLDVRKKGTLEISGSIEGGTVTSGNARLGFEGTDAGKFPLVAALQGRHITLNLDAVAEVLPAVSKDDSRPILTSVYVENGTYAGTDSYRLYVANTPDRTGGAFLIHRAGAEVMAKYKGIVSATVGEREVMVVLDETTTLTARLVDGSFPPFRTLLPANPQNKLTFTDQMVLDLADVMKLGTPDPSNPVRLREVNGELELRINDPSGGRPAVVTTPGGSTLGLSPEATMAFNPQYLLPLLKGTTSNTLWCVDTLRPALVREAAPEFGKGAERLRLIMPVRVS